MKRMLVVVSCCFKGQDGQLCDTTQARLRAARAAYEPGDIVVVTGDVPFAPGGVTLAGLMRRWMLKQGVPEPAVEIGRGVGIFSEARLITRRADELDCDSLHVVSSGWYLMPGRMVWRRRARELGLPITFRAVRGTGGMRTRLFYGVLYAGAVLTARILQLERLLEDRLTQSQQKKLTEGFQWDGCK